MSLDQHPRLPPYFGIAKPKPPKLKSELQDFKEYHEKLEVYARDRANYVEEVVRVLANYPPEKMKMPCLKMLCESKRCPTSFARRENLLMRIELVKRGKIEPMKELHTVPVCKIDVLPNALNPALGLVGIPHDLVQKVFSFVQDPNELLEKLLICKYTFADVFRVFCERTRSRNGKEYKALTFLRKQLDSVEQIWIEWINPWLRPNFGVALDWPEHSKAKNEVFDTILRKVKGIKHWHFVRVNS